MIIPFGSYAPDQPVTGLQGAALAKNCLPITSRSYGPLPALDGYTDAITARCQGAITVRDEENSPHVFAGDASKLYKLNTDGSWEDVSVAGGYSTTSEEQWRFVFMRPNRVVATNFADPIQTYVIGTSTDFANLSGDAPKARYLAVIKGALVAANTWDSSDGYQASRVWWADFGDPTNWPTPGSSDAAAAQSDYQDIGPGGTIRGITSAVGGNDGMVFMDDAIHRVNYSPGTVFDIRHIEQGRGTSIPGSVANIGSLGAFYMGDDGPYLQNGVQSIPIGYQEIDNFILDNLDEVFAGRCVSAIDPKRKIWVFAFVSNDSQDSLPDKAVIYNWAIKQWSTADFSAEAVLGGYTEGYTLEELDQFGTLDSLAYSLDHPAWKGGVSSLGGFTTAHKFGFFGGDNLEATLDTGEVIDPEGRRLLVTGIKPVTDAATVTAAVGYRDGQDDSVSYSTATSPALDQFCKQRVGANYVRGRVVIGSAQTWTHAQGIIPQMQPMGMR